MLIVNAAMITNRARSQCVPEQTDSDTSPVLATALSPDHSVGTEAFTPLEDGVKKMRNLLEKYLS